MVHQVKTFSKADYDGTAPQSLAGVAGRPRCWDIEEWLFFLLPSSTPSQ